MENSKEIQVQERGFVRPLLGVDQAVEAFNQYQMLKTKLRGEGDFVQFTDRQGNVKEAPTKSWRSKLTRFFGISIEVINESIETLPDGSFIVKATARAIAPNGLYMEGDGACWSKTKNEFDYKGNPVDIYHNTRSHAITRAKNRAVLELIGFGEVSAEEIEGEERESLPQPNNTKAINAAPKTINQKQIRLIYYQGSKKGLQKEELEKLVQEWTGVAINELNYAQMNTVLGELGKLPDKEQEK